jgi:RNA ligase (TIGR02306 family)
MSSDSIVSVIEIKNIRSHNDADSLEIVDVFDGYPCIIRKGQFKVGNLAIYIPVDMVVPDEEAYSFLDRRRIKARKIRGVFSMGLLMDIPKDLEGQLKVGDDVTELLRIEKYDEELNYVPPKKLKGQSLGSDTIAAPSWADLRKYDIENIKKYKKVIAAETEVIATEKIHGAFSAYVYRDNALWIRTRQTYKNPEIDNPWTFVAKKYKFEEVLKQFPGVVLYGEVYGKVQPYKYGIPDSSDFVAFEIYDYNTRKFYGWDEFLTTIAKINEYGATIGAPSIQVVPILYRGPYNNFAHIEHFAEGKSLLSPDGVPCREGFVIKPVVEMRDDHLGRVILKLPGQGYLLSKY